MVVYPNPTTNFFSILVSSNSNAPVTIRVYNLLGAMMKIISDVIPGSIVRMADKWENGSYFIQAIQNDQRKTIRAIKANP